MPPSVNFIEHFFGKAPGDVLADDLMVFFRQGHQEGQHLEFKSGNVHMDKILKEMSAFLNSEGGLLIVGAPRESDVPGMEEERQSFGEPDPSDLEDVDIIAEAVRSHLIPAPVGIGIHQVRFNGGSIFLIDVPSSPMPPHQVGPIGTYYLRDGDSSRPATHSELEELFFNKRMPTLQLHISVEKEGESMLTHFRLSNLSSKSASSPFMEVEIRPIIDETQTWTRSLEHKRDYLPKGEEWQEEFQVFPSDQVIFLKVDFGCEDVPVRTKAAFISLQTKTASLLEVYDSQTQPYLNAMDFFNQHSHLLG